MHLLFYRLRPDVSAVCHAHPAIATGFAAAGRALDKAMLPEIVVLLGSVPLAEYATPGTPGLSESLARFMPHYDAILMANHGVVTAGTDLLNAFGRMETVEQFAKTTLVTELLGQQTLLSDREVEKLLEARARCGVTFPPGSHKRAHACYARGCRTRSAHGKRFPFRNSRPVGFTPNVEPLAGCGWLDFFHQPPCICAVIPTKRSKVGLPAADRDLSSAF